MSAPDRNEIASLLAAHGNRNLTDAERRRLESFANDDPELAREIEAVEALHATFADERAVMASVAAPSDPSEEASEEYRRLLATAARTAESLRTKMMHEPPLERVVDVGRRRRYGRFAVLAAAVLIVGLFIAFGDRRPALDPHTPKDTTMGGALPSIVLTAEISAKQPTISWLADARARTYDVVLEDESGRVLLARPAELRERTEWELDTAALAVLLAHDGKVILRIEAKDGAGHTVATSGDRSVVVR